MSAEAATSSSPRSLPSDPAGSADAVAFAFETQTKHGTAWVVESASEVPASVRAAAFAGRGKDFRFYEAIEHSMPDQFKYRYLGLQQAATGEVAVQPFFFVDQDLTMGLPMRLRKVMTGLRRRWPRLLTMRMLMVGCAAAEGQLGTSEPWVVEAMHEALGRYAREARASIILLKDFPASYRGLLAYFSDHGYRRVPSMPAAELVLDFPTFAAFLQERLSKVFRKNLRRKFRALDEVPPVEMEVRHEVEELADTLHALYLQTHERSTMHFEKLTPEFLRELGRRMPDRARFFIWRQEGRVIAFNLCLEYEGTLHDLDMGLDYAVAFALNLYYVTWRDMIQWALAQGLKRYHTGPLNYDPKLHLRLRLAPLDLYARHVSPWINPIFKLAIAYLEPTRHDPVLRQFDNAAEMK